MTPPPSACWLGGAPTDRGSGPEVDLPAFLDQRNREYMADEVEPFADREGGWLNLMVQAADLHPITRACAGFHLWRNASLGQQGV